MPKMVWALMPPPKSGPFGCFGSTMVVLNRAKYPHGDYLVCTVQKPFCTPREVHADLAKALVLFALFIAPKEA